MMRFAYLIDIIIFVASASLFTSKLVRDEYLYQRVSESHNFTANHSFQYCSANESKSSSKEQLVANEVSRWSIYIDLAEGIPSVFCSVLLTSWSDKVGRKIPIAIINFGMALMTISQLCVIYFNLPYYVLIFNGLIYGFSGAFPSLINVSMAYLSDTTNKEDKIKRFTLLECAMGLGGGITTFATGYWIRKDGFIPTSIFAACVAITGVLLVPFLSPSVQKVPKKTVGHENINRNEKSWSKLKYGSEEPEKIAFEGLSNSTFASRLKVVRRIYTSEQSYCNMCEQGQSGRKCEHGGGVRKGRVWRLWFFVAAFSFYLYTVFGTSTYTTMYFTAYPLCFSPVLIGARTLVEYGSLALTPLYVKFSKGLLHWADQTIVVVGLLFYLAITITTSVAREAVLVFIATSLNIVKNVATPAMRAQISSLVSFSEQGAALSLVSAMEALSNMLGMITYLLIYPATLHIFIGFTWLYSTAIACIALSLMIAVWIIDKKSKSDDEEEETETLINH